MSEEDKVAKDPLSESARLLKVRITEFEEKKRIAPAHEQSAIDEALRTLRVELTKTGQTLRQRYGR